MPPRDWRLRIEDMLEAINIIHEYTRGMNFEAFSADRKTVDAVVRNLEVLGEAARHVPPEVQAQHPHLPWSDMRDMRNVVAHGYYRVDKSIVWDAIQRNLPPLIPLLREILEKEA